MKLEEEVKSQLNEENLPMEGKDAKLYKLIFASLGRERKTMLPQDFEVKVLARIKVPLFTWREIAVFSLLALLPIIGMFYFADFAKQVLSLPVISWITDHVPAIGFGILLLFGIQLSDRLILRRMDH